MGAHGTGPRAAAHGAAAGPTAQDYARELKRGAVWLLFEPDVEREFRHSHVLRVRPLARFWQLFQVLAAILSFYTVLSGLARGAARELLLAAAAIHFGISVMLAAAAFGRSFVRRYYRLATVLTPFRAAAVATIVAAVVAGGSSGTSALTINLFGLLFFSGLLLRQALPAAVVMSLAFFAAMAAFGARGAQIAYSMTSLLVLFGLAAFVAWDMQRGARIAFLQHALTRDDATRDALTGLVNRRHFDSQLAAMWDACGKTRQPLTALLIDVDHFKAFNDGYGHQAGDDVLRQVAQALQSAARPGDVVARFGGEEFALVATGLDDIGAEALAGKMRRAVEGLEIRHAGAPATGIVTASIGGACIVPLPGRSAAGVLQMADQNLYAAKREGRNRAVFRAGEYEAMKTGTFRRPDEGA